MPAFRLAYVALFLLALIATFEVWSQVGGQEHLDLLPWWIKCGVAAGVAFATARAAAAAVKGTRAWNGGTLKWAGILLALVVLAGLATYYVHLYYESDEEEEQDPGVPSALSYYYAPPKAAGAPR